MKQEQYTCPKCGAVYERNKHYLAILSCQNFATLISGGKEIKDMCSKCGYMEQEEE